MTVTTLDILDALNEFEADFSATLEAASRKGYEEFTNKGVTTATDYDPVLKMRVRVPVRNKKERIADDAKGIQKGFQAIDNGLRKKMDGAKIRSRADQMRTPDPSEDKYQRAGRNFASNVTDSVGRVEQYVGQVAIDVGIATIQYGIESIGVEIAEPVISAFKEAKQSVGKHLSDFFTEIDPEAGVHFKRAFDVASNNFSQHGLKEGFERTKQYLSSFAKMSTPFDNAKARGIIAGAGAAIGGLVGAAQHIGKSAVNGATKFFRSLPAQAKAAQQGIGEFVKNLVPKEGGMIASATGMFMGMQAALMNSGFAKMVGANFGAMNSQLQALLAKFKGPMADLPPATMLEERKAAQKKLSMDMWAAFGKWLSAAKEVVGKANFPDKEGSSAADKRKSDQKATGEKMGQDAKKMITDANL